MKTQKIAIVGMGAVGTAACIRMVRTLVNQHPNRRYEIHTFEKKNRIGSGLAYATPKDFHLLNMRVDTMSLCRNDPDDFMRWLHQQQDYRSTEFFQTGYVPRRFFGKYLEARFKETKAHYQGRNVIMLHHQKEILDCRELPHGVEIKLEAQTTLFDYVLFCPGHIPSKRERSDLNNGQQDDTSLVVNYLQKGDAKLALQHCHDLLARDPQHIQRRNSP